MPEPEVLEAPALGAQVAAPREAGVEGVLGDLGEQPAAGAPVVLREEEGEGAEGLVDEGVREEGGCETGWGFLSKVVRWKVNERGGLTTAGSAGSRRGGR